MSRSGIATGIVILVLYPIGTGCGRQSPAEPAKPIAAITVTSVSPTSGPTSGDVRLGIAGTGFQPGATVTLGKPATDVHVVNSTLMSVSVPAHEEGTVDVVVTNPGGASGRLAEGYTYVPLALTDVSPRTGLGGDTLKLTGSGFVGGVTVSLGGISARSVTVNNGSSLNVVAPERAAGPVDVTVTNPGGQSAALAAGYLYQAVTVGLSPARVITGGELTVTWRAPADRPAGDWISIFKVGDSNHDYGWYLHTGGAASGTATFTAPAQAGQYEIRYMVRDNAAARSSPVTVTAAQ